MKIPALVTVVLLVLSCTASYADPPQSDIFRTFGHGGRAGYLSPDDDIRRVTAVPDVVTPHIEFAKELAGGSVRVLAIAHKSLGRWPVELLQRFDFEVTTVYCHAPNSMGAPIRNVFFGQRTADVEARILQAMTEPCDVVISDMPVSALGEKVSERLKALMAAGTGYVGLVDVPEWVQTQPLTDHQIGLVKAAVPVHGLRLLGSSFVSHEKAAGEILALRESTSGMRGGCLAEYPRDDKAPEADWLEYSWLPKMEQEAWCSLLGRAALWAAKRIGAGSTLAEAAPQKIDRASLPHQLGLPRGGGYSVRVWDAAGRLCSESTGAFIPVLPNGRYFMVLQKTADGKIADWMFRSFEVMGRVGIGAIALEDDELVPGDRVRAKVSLYGALPGGASALFEVLDNFGRCVFQEKKAAGAEMQFEGDPKESLHLYNYASVKLFGADGLVLDEKRHAFLLAQPNPPADDVSLMVWEGGASFSPRLRQISAEFSKYGVDAMLNAGSMEAALPAAIANAHLVPYVTRVHPGKVNEEGVRSPCLTNPHHNDPLRKKLVETTRTLKAYAPLSYSLGDDQSYLRAGQDGCWSPTCCAAFSKWAQEKYVSIEALNKAWSTAYSEFSEVTPIKRADAFSAVDTDLGPVCHWLDHEIFVDTLVADWHRDMADAIEGEDPNAVAWYDCTVEGWMRPGSGFDFWKLGSLSRFAVQYPNPMVHDILRQTVSPAAYHGTWYGGYGIYNVYPYYDADTQPWWCIFRGINLHGLYYGGTGPNYFDERLLGADLGPMPMFERLMKTVDELRGGIAKLVFNAERQTDGVLIAFSRPSNHLTALLPRDLPMAPQWTGQFTGSPDFVYMQHWEAMAALMSDLGFSYGVARCEDFPGNALDTCRLLVLPLNLRLSQVEADAVRDFVKKGGTVLADAFPGALNGEVRLSDNGLADLFGVEALAGEMPGASSRLCTAATLDGESLGSLTAASALTLKGAVSKASGEDKTPLFLTHQFGEGRAILLNVLSRDYQLWRTQGVESTFREAVAGFLAEAKGPVSPVRCQANIRGDKTPHRVSAVEIHRYQLGGAKYVGLMRMAKMRPDDMIFLADNRPKPVWIQFEEPSHVYDVRRGVYRGHVERFDDVLYPGRTEFYALLPYEVRGLDLACAPVKGGVRVEAGITTAEGTRAGTHVFHVNVYDPSGTERRELARSILCEKGSMEEDIFIGYNAPHGSWTVKVKDVATGTTRESAFSL